MKKILIILLTIILSGCIIDDTDEMGFYIEGPRIGKHKETGTFYDKEGYNKDGYNEYGYNKEGYDKEGYNKDGIDKEGYNKEGYDKTGYNKVGYDREGYNKNGYDRTGYNKEGYDWAGYNKNGYNKEGYDREGYNKDGIDKNGLDRNGYDKNKKFNKKLYMENSFENGFNISTNYKEFTEMALSLMKMSSEEFSNPKIKKDEFETTKEYNKRVKEIKKNLNKIKSDIANNLYEKTYLYKSVVLFDEYDADNEEWILKLNPLYPKIEEEIDDVIIWSVSTYNFEETLRYHMPLEQAKSFEKRYNKLNITYVYKIIDYGIGTQKHESIIDFGKINTFKKEYSYKIGDLYITTQISEYKNEPLKFNKYSEYIYFKPKILGYRLYKDNKVIKEVIY